MKKAIFIDIDGTLFNDKKEISESNIKALKQAKLSGYEIILCTGRPTSFVEKINSKIGNVCHYAITSSGAVVYDLLNKKMLCTNAMTDESVIRLCNISVNHPDLKWIILCTDKSYTTNAKLLSDSAVETPIEESIEKFVKKNKVMMLIAASYNFDLIKNMEPEILKVPGIHITNRHKSLINTAYPRSGYIFYDVSKADTSKGLGIKALCNILNIEKSNRIAIGDDLNDLPMFDECGCCVAMGNALPRIKTAADFITDDNNNDGVAKFLNKHFQKD